jgi:hypothetical protein
MRVLILDVVTGKKNVPAPATKSSMRRKSINLHLDAQTPDKFKVLSLKTKGVKILFVLASPIRAR